MAWPKGPQDRGRWLKGPQTWPDQPLEPGPKLALPEALKPPWTANGAPGGP